MISLSVRRLFPAVLGGFLIGSSLIGFAQEGDGPGFVRISDVKPQGVPVQNASHHVHKGEYHAIDPTCPPGGPAVYGEGCPDGSCYGHGHCYGHCHGNCHLKGLFREHYCTHSPDHGFSVPEKNPIYRRGVQYNRYYPNSWYGAPGTNISPGVVYPTIYQPTDTTQLGFYYQHVPFWQPNPNALPQRPIPAEWHVKGPPSAPLAFNHITPYRAGWGHGHAKFHGKYGRGGDCPPGDIWVETTTGTPASIPNGTVVPNGTPTETVPPATIEAAPPAETTAPPPDASAQAPRIRRASQLWAR